MLLVHILALSLLCSALLYAQNKFCYSVADAVYCQCKLWSFHFLFMRKPTPDWALFAWEWYSRWPLCKVVKHSSGLLTSEIPITSHTNLISLYIYIYIYNNIKINIPKQITLRHYVFPYMIHTHIHLYYIYIYYIVYVYESCMQKQNIVMA